MRVCEYCDSLDVTKEDDYLVCNNCTHMFYEKVQEEKFEELNFGELAAIAKTVPVE